MTESPRPQAEQGTARASAPGPVQHHFLEQAPVPPMDVDGFRATSLGMALFAVASVLAWVFYGDLKVAGNGWWLGVCLSGFALGLVGLAYCRYRSERRRAGHWDRD